MELHAIYWVLFVFEAGNELQTLWVIVDSRYSPVTVKPRYRQVL
jgi:hypothetical protein